jgi:membrane protease YdiL (CAAX protease family)
MTTEEKTLKEKTIAPGFLPSNRQEFTILHLSTIVYAVMATIGVLVAIYGHHNFASMFDIPSTVPTRWQWAAAAVLGAGVLLIASYLFEDLFPSYAALRTQMTLLLGPTSVTTGIYLALTSAVAEELLFRGAILPYTGLFISSLLFGLMHLDPGGRISAWSFWAMLAGLLIGWIFEATGSILPCIAIHFLINAISINRLQRHYRHTFDLIKQV